MVTRDGLRAPRRSARTGTTSTRCSQLNVTLNRPVARGERTACRASLAPSPLCGSTAVARHEEQELHRGRLASITPAGALSRQSPPAASRHAREPDPRVYSRQLLESSRTALFVRGKMLMLLANNAALNSQNVSHRVKSSLRFGATSPEFPCKTYR